VELVVINSHMLTIVQNQGFTRSQYLVRNDLLVAPVLLSPRSLSEKRRPEDRDKRRVYLPYPDEWYPMNLRPDAALGDRLLSTVNGGTHVDYGCPISAGDAQIPYTTPMYIREGQDASTKSYSPSLIVRRCHYS
jgi:alpha-glucosidase (family GH31 glycosyl hydrolase)